MNNQRAMFASLLLALTVAACGRKEATGGTDSAAPQGAASTTGAPDAPATGAKAADKPAGSKMGLGGLMPGGGDKKSTQSVSSAGARGGLPDRDAKGGPNPGVVTVSVTAAEIADFKKGIA